MIQVYQKHIHQLKIHIYRQQYGDYHSERKVRACKADKLWINDGWRRLEFGGKHTISYTEDVL